MTKRPHRAADGNYHIKGKSYKQLFGSRIQVHNGTAYKTEGNLVKSQLFMNKWGRIVSALKHKTAKKENRLRKYGYGAKKGKFGYVRIGATKKMRKGKSRKMRGGDENKNHDENHDEIQNHDENHDEIQNENKNLQSGGESLNEYEDETPV